MSEHPFDDIVWTEVEIVPDPEGKEPHATHEGILKVGDSEIRLFQLSNGQRVVAAEDTRRFMNALNLFTPRP